MTTPFKLMVPMAVLLVMNKFVDQKDPETIFYLQCFFGVGQAIMFLIWAIVYLSIKGDKSLEKKSLDVKKSDLTPPNPLANALGVKDPNSEGPAETMTFAAYDMKMWKSATFQQGMQAVVICFVHYKWGSVMPLVMSVLMSLVNMPSNPLVRVHLFKEDASKLTPDLAAEITRPFKPKTPFDAMMKDAQKKQEEAAIAGQSDAVAEKKKDK